MHTSMPWAAAIALLLALGQTVTWANETVLSIDGSRFTLNGEPTFLLGVSYYGALGAPEEFVFRDLDDFQRFKFNWLRVWATWEGFGEDISAVDSRGQPREPYMSKLQWLIEECDRRGLVVDVTLTRGEGPGRIADFEAHRQAIEALVDALRKHRNWYLDIANERDVGDARYVALDELKTLRELVRQLDPHRLVTASFGGHDLDQSDLHDALIAAELDFVAPHRPRSPESPAETEPQTLRILAHLAELGHVAPIHYQEPFRRGYAGWEPSADDFLNDLRGAVAGGAAGWCFHNGSQREAPDEEPRRSFDLRSKRLFDQLDAEERKVLAGAADAMGSLPGEVAP